MVHLRDYSGLDCDTLVLYLNDNRITRYLSNTLPQPYSPQDAVWWVDNTRRSGQISKVIECYGEMCGAVGVTLSACESEAEIGYWVKPECWNRGIATRAVNLMTALTFSTTRVNRIVNPVSAPNTASSRVMQKAGYTFEKRLYQVAQRAGIRSDELLYVKQPGYAVDSEK